MYQSVLTKKKSVLHNYHLQEVCRLQCTSAGECLSSMDEALVPSPSIVKKNVSGVEGVEEVKGKDPFQPPHLQMRRFGGRRAA